MKNNFYILTNDPSMTAWGYAVISNRGRIVTTGCIKTAPEHKKKRIRKGDDTIRRISDINKQLLDVIHGFNIKYILSELPHGSQNASAAVMLGIVTGILQTIGDALDIGIEWYSEMDSKKNALNRKAVTKDDMLECMKKLYPSKWWKGVKYYDEAVADALAIYDLAKRVSPTLKLIR